MLKLGRLNIIDSDFNCGKKNAIMLYLNQFSDIKDSTPINEQGTIPLS